MLRRFRLVLSLLISLAPIPPVTWRGSWCSVVLLNTPKYLMNAVRRRCRQCLFSSRASRVCALCMCPTNRRRRPSPAPRHSHTRLHPFPLSLLPSLLFLGAVLVCVFTRLQRDPKRELQLSHLPLSPELLPFVLVFHLAVPISLLSPTG